MRQLGKSRYRPEAPWFIVISLMRLLAYVVPLVLALPGCGGGSSNSGDSGNSGDDGSCEVDEPLVVDPLDTSACMPAVTDYLPGSASADMWPSCVTDDGEYHLIDTTPSSIARVAAYEQVMELLRVADPGPDDFTAARTIYAMDEGLESRLGRREDLHFAPVPQEDWDPGFDPDKQCSAASNVTKYPDRCAGPARIAPLINEAFAAGQTAQGEPAVHVARIEAALLWFLHLSVYKEANTCIGKAKDCDSAWAYYTGGFDRSGGIGLSGEVQQLSDLAHQRIWDGFSAYRCWRELYDIEQYPTLDDLDEQGRMLQALADAQLDEALWHGWALIVRDRLAEQGGLCGREAEANWAFLRVAGPVLTEEALRRDTTTAAELTALWATDEPDAQALTDAIAAVDTTFGCP